MCVWGYYKIDGGEFNVYEFFFFCSLLRYLCNEDEELLLIDFFKVGYEVGLGYKFGFSGRFGFEF